MSDPLYGPSQAAIAAETEPWSEAFRTQRDVGLLVPINFHTVPSVSLRAACFSHNQYEDTAFQQCFSNLLAVGLRRYDVDLYWDALRSVWSLCPVEIPPSGPGAPSTVSSIASSSPTGAALAARAAALALGAVDGALPVTPRQNAPNSLSISNLVSSSSQLVGVSPTASVSSPSASTSSTPIPSPVSFTTNGSALIQIGNYNCTSTMTLGYLTGILDDFLDVTSTTTDANLNFVFLNIHAAASWMAPNAPAQKPLLANMPGPGNLLSDIMNGNLSSDLYTPQKLQGDRADLNRTWLDVGDANLPAAGYYRSTKDASNRAATQDGWPTEAYLVFTKLFRLLVSFGTIDPQMAEYNTTADQDTLFARGSIHSPHDVAFRADGSLSSGCLFAPSEDSITLTTNSSWAVATTPNLDISPSPDLSTPVSAVTNLTTCGVSALLNSTLADTTADENPLPYAAFVNSHLWAWAPGEPQNASISATSNRCAAISPTGPLPGRWHATNCTETLRVACQDPSTPYHWAVSAGNTSYASAPSACVAPLVFSVPHTALENAHLLAAMRAAAATDAVLLDLNMLDVDNCWVAGVNSTCPYIPSTDTSRTRIVVVPTVAAVLIFVLAALTFFVKCAANRREDKRGRRRRMVGGWEYEGVPS